MATTEFKDTVTPELEGRIDLMVRSLIDLPRSKLNLLFDHGCVSLNGTVCKNSATRVSAGDAIIVNYDSRQGYSKKKRPWSDRTFTIIHEDDDLLVINKASGVLTVPTNKEETNTLLERVTAYLDRKKKNHEAYLIHRLDRGMSGTMVFGKTPKSAKHLRTQFDHDQARRIVFVIVNGELESKSGVFESQLDTHSNLSRYSTSEKGQGQRAVTRYKVTQELEDATGVELELVTARRHQARVHFCEFGHHILGDTRYRQQRFPHEKWEKKRLAMHSVEISFIHPTTMKPVTFKSPLPMTLRKFIRGSRKK